MGLLEMRSITSVINNHSISRLKCTLDNTTKERGGQSNGLFSCCHPAVIKHVRQQNWRKSFFSHNRFDLTISQNTSSAGKEKDQTLLIDVCLEFACPRMLCVFEFFSTVSFNEIILTTIRLHIKKKLKIQQHLIVILCVISWHLSLTSISNGNYGIKKWRVYSIFFKASLIFLKWDAAHMPCTGSPLSESMPLTPVRLLSSFSSQAELMVMLCKFGQKESSRGMRGSSSWWKHCSCPAKALPPLTQPAFTTNPCFIQPFNHAWPSSLLSFLHVTLSWNLSTDCVPFLWLLSAFIVVQQTVFEKIWILKAP